MVALSQETQTLAERLAAAQSLSVDAAIRRALEARANVTGLPLQANPVKRMTVDEMPSFGAEIAAMPLLDPRYPDEIMGEINAL